MKMMKSVALMAMGSALTLVYQKYNKPMMKDMKNLSQPMKEWRIRG